MIVVVGTCANSIHLLTKTIFAQTILRKDKTKSVNAAKEMVIETRLAIIGGLITVVYAALVDDSYSRRA